jgi:hypothetical protein
VDEASGIHEKSTQLQQYTGLLVPITQPHSWILWCVLLKLVVGVFFSPFLSRYRTALLMILSGIIFLGGALGVETLGAGFGTGKSRGITSSRYRGRVLSCSRCWRQTGMMRAEPRSGDCHGPHSVPRS